MMAGTAKSLTKSGNGTLILSATNNYTGNTEVKSGVLILAAPDALGRTEYLYLSRGAELDMNGYPQTISKPLTAAGSQAEHSWRKPDTE